MGLKAFRITGKGGRGFQIAFENGVTVSIQIGAGNYGDNYDMDFSNLPRVIESNTAEVAIIKEDGVWITHEYDRLHDEVMGYQSLEEVLKILEWAEKYEPK